MASTARKMMQDSDEMDMTPMIDIVFNLLIFFMVVSDLTQKDLANLTLPLAYKAVEDKDDDPDDRVILNVDNSGQVLYRGEPINLDRLGEALRDAKRTYKRIKRMKEPNDPHAGEEKIAEGVYASKLFVLLRADKDTPWQHVQWLMTIMAEQKFYKLQFACKKYVGAGYHPETVEGKEEIDQLDGRSVSTMSKAEAGVGG